MKRRGVYAQIHSRPTIQGGLMMKVHGDETFHMPPLRLVQDSGVPWGLGSDATAVTPTNPFYTLWWAVTGRMIAARKCSATRSRGRRRSSPTPAPTARSFRGGE